MTAHRFVGLSTLLFLSLAQPLLAVPNAKESPAQDHWYSPSRYNPLKLFKRTSNSAEDRLNGDADLTMKLTTQLRAHGQLPPTMDLRDACTDFRDLTLCIAALRVSHNLKIDFSCLKWDVNGLKPARVSNACAGPAGGKSMSLARAIDLLKPDADSRHEASDAFQQARNEIKDASS